MEHLGIGCNAIRFGNGGINSCAAGDEKGGANTQWDFIASSGQGWP